MRGSESWGENTNRLTSNAKFLVQGDFGFFDSKVVITRSRTKRVATTCGVKSN